MRFCNLDSPAGHILCGFALILFGAGFWAAKIPKHEDLIIAGTTTIGIAMRGKTASGENK